MINTSVNSLIVPPELVQDMETAFKDAFSASFGKAELLAALLLFSCCRSGMAGPAELAFCRLQRMTPDSKSVLRSPLGRPHVQRYLVRDISAVALSVGYSSTRFSRERRRNANANFAENASMVDSLAWSAAGLSQRALAKRIEW